MSYKEAIAKKYPTKLDLQFASSEVFVKLRQGSGKDWQGMAVKEKGLKALSLAKSLH